MQSSYRNQFIDSRVPKDLKFKIIEKINSTEASETDNVKKILLREKDVLNFIISEFVTFETLNFFTSFKIPIGFSETNPDTWQEREDFQKGYQIVTNLSVVNDAAE